MVELWFADYPGQVFNGQFVHVPADAIRIAIDQPRLGTPSWFWLSFLGGAVMLLGAMVTTGFGFRSKRKVSV